MIVTLAIASLFVAAADDAPEDDRLVRFHLLRGMGDLDEAYRVLFEGLDQEVKEEVVEQLLAQIHAQASIEAAAALMNEVLTAAHVSDDSQDTYDRLVEAQEIYGLFWMGSVTVDCASTEEIEAAWNRFVYIERYDSFSRTWGLDKDTGKRIVDVLPGRFAVISPEESVPFRLEAVAKPESEFGNRDIIPLDVTATGMPEVVTAYVRVTPSEGLLRQTVKTQKRAGFEWFEIETIDDPEGWCGDVRETFESKSREKFPDADSFTSVVTAAIEAWQARLPDPSTGTTESKKRNRRK